MQAELQSRLDVFDAQVEKLQRGLAGADEEKSRLEQQLQEAQAALAAATNAGGNSSKPIAGKVNGVLPLHLPR